MKIFSRTKTAAPQLASQRPKWLFIVQLFFAAAIIAILASLALSLWMGGKPAPWMTELGLSAADRLSAARPNIVNLRITGQDALQRPYILTASGIRPESDSIFRGMIMQSGRLADVEANIQLSQDSWLSLKSSAGRFDTEKQRLLAGPGFALYASRGYQLHGDNASIDFKSGAIIVHGEVEAWGPIGEISAAALDAKKKRRLFALLWRRPYRHLSDESMMIKWAVLALLLCLWPLPLAAEVIPGFGGDRDQPITIQSEELAIDRAAAQALFSGGVEAKQSGLTIKSRRMNLIYRAEPDVRIKFLYASGDVWLIGRAQPGKTPPIARGQLAEYNVETSTLILSDDVALERDGHIVTGQSLTIDMASGESRLDSTEKGKPGRVRGLIQRPKPKDKP